MRQIVFRGYSTKYKSWHYGSLELAKGGKCFIKSFYDNGSVARTRVEEESIGQFTEFYDCEDKPIYEGDLVEDTTYEEGGSFEVTMNNGTWTLMDEQGNYGDLKDYAKISEVIGAEYDF